MGSRQEAGLWPSRQFLLLAEPQVGEGDHFFEAWTSAEAVGSGLSAHLLKEGGCFSR